MYLYIGILTLVFFIYIFSQFGSRLLARHAFIWWLVSFFLILSIFWPELFQKLSTFLGVNLASNLIFAGLILFILFMLIEQSAENTKTNRLLREFMTHNACEYFLKILKRAEVFQSPIKTLIVLPVYNEEKNIQNVYLRLATLNQNSYPYCLINDGSTDHSEEMLQTLVPQNFTSHGMNMGVAAVLLTGFKIAKKLGVDYVVQCDGDGQHPIEKIPDFVTYAHEKKLDLLIGSRFSKNIQPSLSGGNTQSSLQSTTLLRWVGGHLISLVMLLFRVKTKVTDPTSGFRVYSIKAMDYLVQHMPDEYPEPENIALLSWVGMKVGEIRISMEARVEGNSSLTGLKSFQYMIKVLTALIGLRLRVLLALE